MSFCSCNRTYMSMTKDSRGVRRAADFDFYPTKKGSTFLLFKGIMMSSRNEHKRAAVKVLRQERGEENRLQFYFDTASIAAVVLKKFKMAVDDAHGCIILPNCYEARMDTVSSYSSIFRHVKHYSKKIVEGEHVIIEKFIKGIFQDFILDKGSVLSSCPYILEAFSHFSYHHSNGQYLLCGLKGVRKMNRFYLTVPNIHSRTPGQYGKKDKGTEGMEEFFRSHTCNDLCRNLLQFSACDSHPPAYWSVVGEFCRGQH